MPLIAAWQSNPTGSNSPVGDRHRSGDPNGIDFDLRSSPYRVMLRMI